MLILRGKLHIHVEWRGVAWSAAEDEQCMRGTRLALGPTLEVLCTVAVVHKGLLINTHHDKCNNKTNLYVHVRDQAKESYY